MTVAVRVAVAADAGAVVALVESAGLPSQGLLELVDAGEALVAVDDRARVLGCVALEPVGDERLLRSLAVDADRRGQGVGSALVAAALDRHAGPCTWALTEAAERFLVAHGFAPVDRSTVVDPLTRTDEWTTLCPGSAIVLRHPGTPDRPARP